MKDEELDMLIANVEYEPQQLKDYITNLQEENQRLRKDYATLIHDNCFTLQLEQRIDKAIEYIPILRRCTSYEKDEKLDNLLGILGGDK